MNTKPLVFGLAERLPQAEIVYDLPSRLADQLAAGSLDAALIPSIEYFQNPAYAIVSDACIACRGPVLSVKLFSRVLGERIETLCLDEGSRTSAALARILLQEKFHRSPTLQTLPIDADPASVTTDALLLIGDRAINEPPGDWAFVWDLGDQWLRWSELPFVFAMWVMRSGIEPDRVVELDAALRRSRDDGLAHLPLIAEREAGPIGISVETCLTYLRDNLHFILGPREQRGLNLFHRHAAELGLAPPSVPVDELESTVT